MVFHLMGCVAGGIAALPLTQCVAVEEVGGFEAKSLL